MEREESERSHSVSVRNDVDCWEAIQESCKCRTCEDPFYNIYLPLIQLLFLLTIGLDIFLNIWASWNIFSNGVKTFGFVGLLISIGQMKLNTVYFLSLKRPFEMDSVHQLLHPGWSLVMWLPFGLPLLMFCVYPQDFINAVLVELLSYLVFPFVYLALVLDHIHLWTTGMHLREDIQHTAQVILVKVVATWYEAVPQMVLQTFVFFTYGVPSWRLWLGSFFTGSLVTLFFLFTIYRDVSKWRIAKKKDDLKPLPDNIEVGGSSKSQKRLSQGGIIEEDSPIKIISEIRKQSLEIPVRGSGQGIKTTKYQELAARNAGRV